MSRSVSTTLKNAVFAQETSEAFIILIKIEHVDLASDILVSSDSTEDLPIAGVRGTISNSVEYIQLPFQLVLQEQTDNLLARAKLVIDNVNREIILAIRTANNTPPIVTISIVLASDPDTVEISIPNLRLNNIRANAFTVEGELQPQIIQGEQFPFNTFNQADFPGIFGG